MNGSSCNMITSCVAVTQTNLSSTQKWHLRLGHLSKKKGLTNQSKQSMLGNDFISDLPFCEPCVMAKQYRHSFLSGIHLYKEILDYPHADLWGPESHEFHGENKYFFSIFMISLEGF